jgi:hypothetical protein
MGIRTQTRRLAGSTQAHMNTPGRTRMLGDKPVARKQALAPLVPARLALGP